MGEAVSFLTLVVVTGVGMAFGAGAVLLARIRRTGGGSATRQVDDRRLVEQALRHSEDRLHLALEAGNLGI
jgi:PAS domain-containing protein